MGVDATASEDVDDGPEGPHRGGVWRVVVWGPRGVCDGLRLCLPRACSGRGDEGSGEARGDVRVGGCEGPRRAEGDVPLGARDDLQRTVVRRP